MKIEILLHSVIATFRFRDHFSQGCTDDNSLYPTAVVIRGQAYRNWECPTNCLRRRNTWFKSSVRHLIRKLHKAPFHTAVRSGGRLAKQHKIDSLYTLDPLKWPSFSAHPERSFRYSCRCTLCGVERQPALPPSELASI